MFITNNKHYEYLHNFAKKLGCLSFFVSSLSDIIYAYTNKIHDTHSTAFHLSLFLMCLHLLYWLYFKKRGVRPSHIHIQFVFASILTYDTGLCVRFTLRVLLSLLRFLLIPLFPVPFLHFSSFFTFIITTPKRRPIPMCNTNSFITKDIKFKYIDSERCAAGRQKLYFFFMARCRRLHRANNDEMSLFFNIAFPIIICRYVSWVPRWWLLFVYIVKSIEHAAPTGIVFLEREIIGQMMEQIAIL